jgi:hypothetical protein
LRDNFANLARCLGVRVVENDIDAVEEKPSGPTATDDTATEQADALNLSHVW